MSRPILTAITMFAMALAAWPTLAQSEPPTGPPVDQSQPAGAPEGEADSAPPTETELLAPTAQEIQDRITAIEASTDLEESAKAQRLLNLRDALEILKQGDEWAARAAEFRKTTNEAPVLLQTIREELARPPAEPRIEAPPDATLQQVEQELQRAQAELDAFTTRRDELAAESTRRTGRRTEIPPELARLTQRRGEIDDAVQGVVRAQQDAENDLNWARLARILAEQRAVRLHIEALEQELVLYDAAAELLPARRDRAARRVTVARKIRDAWSVHVERLRTVKTQEAKLDARQLAERVADIPALKAIADQNIELVANRTGPDGLSKRIEAETAAVNELRKQLDTMRGRYRNTQRRIAAGGLTPVLGLKLLSEYQELPSVSSLRSQRATVRSAMVDAQDSLFEYEDQRTEIGDLSRRLEELWTTLPPAQQTDETRGLAEQVLAAHRDSLDTLIREYTTYVDRLVERDLLTNELTIAAAQYEDFLRERILWIRSVTGSMIPNPGELTEAAGWLFFSPRWPVALQKTGSAMLTFPERTAAGAIVLVLVFVAAGRSRRSLRRISAHLNEQKIVEFNLTLKALLATLILAAPIPVVMIVAAHALRLPPLQESVALAAAQGLLGSATLIYALLCVMQVLRPNGLAEDHLRWSSEASKVVRLHLHWYVPLAGTCAFVYGAMEAEGGASYHNSLGRLAFTVYAFALGIFCLRVLRLSGPVVGTHISRHPTGWLNRLRYLWYPTAVLLPTLLGLAALTGYYYTATEFGFRVRATIWLVIGLVLAHGLFMRWLLLFRWRAAVDEARKKRKAEARAAEAAGGVDAEGAILVVDETTIDMPRVDANTRKLFNTAAATAVLIGFFVIWADVLPALRFLERVHIWPELTVVPIVDSPGELGTLANSADPALSGQAAATNSAAAAAPSGPSGGALPIPLVQPQQGAEQTGVLRDAVTLADLAIALLIIIFTFAAVRSLPGLLEVFLLRRLPLDAGARYAMATISRYVIVGIGVFATLGALGIGWSKIQWLAAALTFGLAFGLQEIFANFISGIIILVERPIRLGDIVSIGNVDGTVTRIRIRATTVTDWDRKELLIPNKDFITGQLINWSLSDKVTRVTIPVGIAYGSDVEKARSILLQLAAECSNVMEDPKPGAVFWSFGASSLDLQLRVFIATRDVFVDVVNELQTRIHTEFEKAGIVIAFPQLDLHVKEVAPRAELVSGENVLAQTRSG